MAIPRWLRRLVRRPDLEALEVEGQCGLPWEAIHGTGPVRRCDHCATAVHDLSKLSRREIRKLVRSGESFCGRIERDADGRLVTAPTPPRRAPAVGLMAIPAWLGLVATPQLTGRGCDASPTGEMPVASADGLTDADELRVRASHEEAERRLAEEASRNADGTNFPGGVPPEDLAEPLETWEVIHEPVADFQTDPDIQSKKVRYRKRSASYGIIRSGDF